MLYVHKLHFATSRAETAENIGGILVSFCWVRRVVSESEKCDDPKNGQLL